MVDVTAHLENSDADTAGTPRPRIEFVMLADKAEVINGKVYVMGRCWDHAWGETFPLVYPTSIAVRVILPDAGVRQLRLDFRLEGPGEPEVQPKGLLLERSGEATNGLPDKATIAVAVALVLPQPGRYQLIVSLDGEASEPLAFAIGQLTQTVRAG